jgi:hypothetical protein
MARNVFSARIDIGRSGKQEDIDSSKTNINFSLFPPVGMLAD